MNKKFTVTIINLCILFVCLVSFSIFVIKDAYGWLKSNRNVGASNMGISAQAQSGDVRYAIGDGTFLANGQPSFDEFEDLNDGDIVFADTIIKPGTSFYLKLEITNNSGDTLSIDSIGFKAPTVSEEVPVEVDGVAYYFGTQLSVKTLYVDGVSYTSTKKYLYDSSATLSENGDVLFYEDDVTLEVNETITLIVEIKFENTNENQDVYKDFGRTGTSTCKRRLVLNFVK